MEQFLNEDTKLVLFYKDRIELENNKISNLLVTDISTFKLRTQSIKSILYPLPNQPSPLLSPVTLTVFQSDYEIMINYFRIVEKGLYSIGYYFISPQGLYFQRDNSSNEVNDKELFKSICNSVMQIYGDKVREKKLDSFFLEKQLPSLPPMSYVPGYLVDQLLLSQ